MIVVPCLFFFSLLSQFGQKYCSCSVAQGRFPSVFLPLPTHYHTEMSPYLRYLFPPCRALRLTSK